MLKSFIITVPIMTFKPITFSAHCNARLNKTDIKRMYKKRSNLYDN